MDYVTIFKQRMKAAILARPENTPEVREAVYRKTREFVAFSAHAHTGAELETAIADLEQEFRLAEHPEEALATPAARKRGLPRWLRHAAAGVAIAAALAVATFLLLYRPPSDPEFDRGFADYSSSARGFENIPAWTTYYRAGSEGDLRFVEATGTVPLYSKQVFAVTPGNSYRLSARVRVIKDDPAKGGAQFLAGTVSYDDNGNPIGPDIAPAQYCTVKVSLIKAADGWTEVEGILSFDSKDPYCLLPPGTVGVRLVALLNVGSKTSVSQIDYLRFEAVNP